MGVRLCIGGWVAIELGQWLEAHFWVMPFGFAAYGRLMGGMLLRPWQARPSAKR